MSQETLEPEGQINNGYNANNYIDHEYEVSLTESVRVYL